MGEVFVVEAHRVPDGVFGLVRVSEISDVYLLAFQHLVVQEKALELGQPVFGKLAVVFVDPVFRIFQMDADDLLVVLTLVYHVHHPYWSHPEEA